MAPEKVERKDAKDKVTTKEEKKVEIEAITAVYKVNLHCQECGRKIRKHLLVQQGVQSVEIDIENGEIKAKGKLDPLKIHKLIEIKSKKKVELISPKVTPKETSTVEKRPKETKEPIIRTISVKVHMHCDKCERDLRNRLIEHKGIFSVKTDIKVQTVTVEGTIEQEKLISYLRKRVHKNAEIISSKEKEKEKKEKGKDDGKSSEQSKEKGGSKSGETTKTTEGDAKAKENAPYMIHYVYAPQLFSDENPNACSIL